jgi:hypothetical protein
VVDQMQVAQVVLVVLELQFQELYQLLVGIFLLCT